MVETAEMITQNIALMLGDKNPRRASLMSNKALFNINVQARGLVVRYLNKQINIGNKSAKFIKSELQGNYYD